jgi:hypothetical protein
MSGWRAGLEEQPALKDDEEAMSDGDADPNRSQRRWTRQQGSRARQAHDPSQVRAILSLDLAIFRRILIEFNCFLEKILLKIGE